MTKDKLFDCDWAELWRDWFNNFMTIERFAEYYGISVKDAQIVIKTGARLHEIKQIQYAKLSVTV